MNEKIVARFWANVEKRGPDDCWLWKGSSRNGYGRLYAGKRLGGSGAVLAAHRLSVRLATGAWPKKLVLHRCHNKLCCNPAHLREGTHQDNMDDRKQSGRTARGERSAKKLTKKQVCEIRKRYEAGGVLQRELAEEFGITRTMVGYIVRGDWWK